MPEARFAATLAETAGGDVGKDSASGKRTRPMNPLSRLVARLGISIRSKLLVAFLGITLLMGGVAQIGLVALEKANERTEALIRDQLRFAFQAEVYGYLAELQVIALAAGLDREETSDGSTVSELASGVRLENRLQYLLVFLGQGARKFGGEDSEEGGLVWALRQEAKGLLPFAQEIRKRSAENTLSEVSRIAALDFIPEARRLQRDVFTRMKTIEEEMAEKARITASSYVRSSQQVIGAALAAIGLALLVGYAMSSALIWPVRRIGETLHRVAGGGFDARVAVPNRDEMGTLAENVNTMSSQLGALYQTVEAQKAELEGLNTALEDKVAVQVDEIARTNRLRRFLPAQVADLIVEGESEADMLGTRRGEVTVLFADLRGFTAFANAVPPAQVIGALNAFHASAGPVVEAHGGTIERFLGDGVMVLFGAPVAMEDAAQRAVDTAVAMMAAVQNALSDMGPAAKDLGLGIGIGSGVATLGQIGFEGRQDYSAIGPAPNLAARLCDVAAAGQILISHATAWQVTTEMEPVGPFDLKGIGPEIAAFQITRE